jgi:hypothetical protein
LMYTSDTSLSISDTTSRRMRLPELPERERE